MGLFGLSLPKRNRVTDAIGAAGRGAGRLVEVITPQNEQALRNSQANLARANQAMAQPAKYGVLRNAAVQRQTIRDNQPVKFNAPKVYGQVAGDVALNTFAGGVKRFGQSGVSTLLSPYSNRLADQERRRAERLLKPAYGNLYAAYGQDRRLGENQAEIEAGQADYALRTDPLNRSGIGVNDSKGTVIRKVGAQGAEAFLDIASAGTAPTAFKAAKLNKAYKPSIIAGGVGGGASNAAYLAQQDDVKNSDVLKSITAGVGTGMVMPTLGAVGGKLKGKSAKLPKDAQPPKPTVKFKQPAEVNNEPAYLRTRPKSIEEARIQRQSGINGKMQKKTKSPAQLEYEAALAARKAETNPIAQLNQKGIEYDNPLDVPTFQRRADVSKVDAEIKNIDRQLAAVPEKDMQVYKFEQKKNAGKAGSPERKLYERRMKQFGNLEGLQARRAELIAQRDSLAKNKQLLTNAQGELPDTRPKVTTKPQDVVDTPPVKEQPTPDSTYRPRTADEAIREIAGIGGEEIGQASTGLGLTGKAISTVTGGKYTTTRGLNPFRAASDKAGRAFNEASEASITGATGAPVVNKGRAVFAGTGLADETKQIARVRTGQNANINDLMTRVHSKADDIQSTYGDAAKELIDRTVRDEAYTQRVYGEAPRRLEDLPEELQGLVREKMDQNRVVNDLNRQTGIINEETWKAGTEGQHIGRVFNIPKSEKQMIREGVGAMLETNAGIKRKDISKMADEVIEFLEKDPIRAIDLRMEMALRNKVFSETMDSYADRGFIKKRAPNDSYLQINGKKWGKYDGQFIERGILEDLTDNRVFNNEMMQSYDKFITGYKSSIIGTSDRLQKAFKTTMAPGTIVGNFFSNPMIFNVGAGTNPLTQIYDMVGAYRKMAKGLSDADVYEARKLGVIGGDSGRILTGTSNEQLAIGKAKENVAKRALNKFGRFYGAIDDGAKLGLWKRLQKQGMNAQDAALEVAKFTQDYNNVGRTITLIADTPVLGKPFARFSPELVRLIKNNATRAPHRLLAGIAAIAYIGNKMSESTGESEQERAAREGAVGQTKIPGTAWINKLMGGPDDNISLNLAAGDTSINIARSMGLNFPIEPGTDPNRALIEQLLPFEIPVTKDALGNDKFDPTKVVTSMTMRPAIEQLFDRNFMGRRVSDPTNQAYDSQGNVMKFNDLPKSDQVKNRLRALATSTLPLGNEIDSLQAAFRGKATALGKERTVPQALLRTVGIKTEDNSPEARAKRADTAEYFEVTKKAESNFLNNNKDLEELYFKVFPKTKDRETGKKLSDQITPEKWGRVQSDTSGRLYDFMKQQALSANKMDGTPVDPVFKIPTKEQQRQVLELRSKPTGEDIEMDNIMEATQGWYREFKKAESKYYEDSTAYYKSKNLPDTQNQRAKDYANVKWPEQDKLISQYYATKEKNPDAAKAMFETTNLSQAFDKYKQDKLKYYNAKRKIEGYPPISESTFNNVTFGYEDDERKVFNTLKYGKGYGGYGGRGGSGGRGDGSFNTSKYLSSVSAGGKGSRPKVSVSVKKVKVAPKYAASKKPTVSIKKSRV